MSYNKIKLKDGELVVMGSYIVITETKTETSNYAGVIAEKNDSIPEYIIFSDIPITEYSSEREEELYKRIGKIHPEIESVRRKQINIVDGKSYIFNADEWDGAPRLGLFAIPEVKTEDEMLFGTGIFRKEN